MENNNTKGLIVKKNPLISARYKLSINEIRIFNFLVSEVGKDDTEIKEHKIKFSEIVDECNINSGNFYKTEAEFIKETVIKLKSRVIQIETEKAWEVISLFEKASILKDKKGNYIPEVIFKLSEDVRPLILNLKNNFTKIDFSYIKNFTSTYSVRFYEISLSELRNSSNCTYQLSVSHIKYIFDIQKKYKRFETFKRSVLNKAKKEINEKTNIIFDFELIYSKSDKRKIESIKFIVSRKKTEKEPLVLEVKSNYLITSFDDEEQELYNQIIGYGVDNKKAKKIVETYQLNQISNALEVVKHDLNNPNKNINNISGYVVSAIEKDFKLPSEFKWKNLNTKIKELTEKLADLKKSKDDMKSEFTKNRISKVRDIFLNDKEETINFFVDEMVSKNKIHYNFCIKMHPWIKDYSNRKLVEINPKSFAYCINKMLDEYSLKVWIEADEKEFKKKILDMEKLILKFEKTHKL